MGNKDLLTEAELAAWRPPPAMLDRIEAHRSRLGVDPAAFRILDFGCGRGKLVLWLRERGYDAVGVDVDPRPFEYGAPLFRSRGQHPEKCLVPLDSAGRSPFPESSFDFVVSNQVLEHVDDLGRAVAELRRVTRAGGEGFHVYPPHRRLVEGHLFMPFVHWLPKGRLRRQLITAYVLVGIEPHWWPRGRMPLRERAAVYYDYSVRETFYRPPAVLRSAFTEGGFETDLVDLRASQPLRKLFARVGLGPSSAPVRAWITNFAGDVGLATRLTN